MERRTALAIATAAAGTILAASAAFAANVGLLTHDDATPVGILDASTVAPAAIDPADPTVVTVIVEDPPAQVAAVGSADSRSTSLDDSDVNDDSDEWEGTEVDDHSGPRAGDDDHESRDDDD
jgi:hypothetical protein